MYNYCLHLSVNRGFLFISVSFIVRLHVQAVSAPQVWVNPSASRIAPPTEAGASVIISVGRGKVHSACTYS